MHHIYPKVDSKLAAKRGLTFVRRGRVSKRGRRSRRSSRARRRKTKQRMEEKEVKEAEGKVEYLRGGGEKMKVKK